MARATVYGGLLVLFSIRPAFAAEDDYRVENRGWNGLSDFLSIARGKQLDVRAPSHLNFAEVDPTRDAIALFYPRGSGPDIAEKLQIFVQAGGRLLVADDFGDGDVVFRRFDVERADAPKARDLHQGNPNLPIARPWGNHELGAGVSAVVLNHPAGFVSRLQPVLMVRAPVAVPVAVVDEIEAGRVLLCADPSVFINNMLGHAGNFAFAVNVVDWLGRPGGRLWLLSQEFVASGTVPSAQPASARLRDRFLPDFNAFLDEMSAYTPVPLLLQLVGLLAALGALASLLSAVERPHGKGHRHGSR